MFHRTVSRLKLAVLVRILLDIAIFLLPVRGETCSAMIKATAGDDLTTLRDKTFAAFRKKCRPNNEIKSCSLEVPLGMKNKRIPDDYITASSVHGSRADHGPSRARLNTTGLAAAWCNDKATDDISPWIQVDFNDIVTITGLITQGRGDDEYPYPQWVKEYHVTYSGDGQSWDQVTDGDGTPIKFPGNNDMNTLVTARFPFALRTRILRIHPIAWNGHCSMRFEVIGC